jgi:hypothetical protein
MQVLFLLLSLLVVMAMLVHLFHFTSTSLVKGPILVLALMTWILYCTFLGVKPACSLARALQERQPIR